MAEMKEKIIYSNKMAIIQVLGALASNPLLLGDEKYRFSPSDFPENFHRYVFKAILSIALQSDDGDIDIARIDPIDVDRFLKNYPEWYQVFSSNDGVNWLRRAMEAYDPGKFHYYYNTLKKNSLLNAMQRAGIDTTPILNPNLVDPNEIAKQREAFDAMGVKDILNSLELAVVDLKDKYDNSDSVLEAEAGDSVYETLQALKEAPEIGAGYMSDFLTTAFRGQRLGTVVVETAPQGVGKSRRQAGESVHLAVPEKYNLETGEWEKTGYNLSVLLISSELTLKETQYMWLAYLSGVPEERIILNQTTPAEYERVLHAADLLQKANLTFVEISNYDINDIENLIKKYVLAKHVTHIYFDYVGTTQKIMSTSSRATKISNLREDQVLLLFMERLKNLAKIMNVAIYTATQVTGNWKEIKEADQQMIRGAKAIADKPDGGWVLLPVREADRMIIDQYKDKGFVQEPTHVLHIYKNRGNPYVNIRIYGYFQRNLCRWQDCFVTDFQGHMLEMKPTRVVWDEPEPKEEKPAIAAEPEKGADATKRKRKAKLADGDEFGELTEEQVKLAIESDELPFDDALAPKGPTSTHSPASWGLDSAPAQAESASLYSPIADEEAEEDEAAEDDGEAEGVKDTSKADWGGANPYSGFDF